MVECVTCVIVVSICWKINLFLDIQIFQMEEINSEGHAE